MQIDFRSAGILPASGRAVMQMQKWDTPAHYADPSQPPALSKGGTAGGGVNSVQHYLQAFQGWYHLL